MTVLADETAIRALFQRLQDAHAARDAEGILACYASDVRLFGLAPPLGQRGQQGDELKAWLDSWDEPVRMEEQGSELDIEGDLAVSTGYLRFEGTKAGADQTLWFRSTSVLRRGPDGWRIIHDHSSVPMAMDGSGRAETGLPPGDR
jgi:ketosteroid isomerase-like protein